MISKKHVEEFAHKVHQTVVMGCSICHGEDASCECCEKFRVIKSAYEAGIPRAFWNIMSSDVNHNISVLKNVVTKYLDNLHKAHSKGYGLLFLGDNGVGKTFFISYILMEAIRRGYTAYYTTLPQLDLAIKSSFGDKLLERRLNFMLTSDFVAIDEMGKEKYESKNAPSVSFMDAALERILKQRCDSGDPVLLATNLGFEALLRTYGPTIGSIISGSCRPVIMKSGDYRQKLATRMNEEMGY